MSRPLISAAILARNEEQTIAFCLETIKWCNEIVVVDMESEDGTADVARRYTKKVFSHPVVLKFDAVKQEAVERTTGDWVLLIDADEMVPLSLARRLQEVAAEDAFDVVEIPFRHYIMGEWIRHSGWGYSVIPRFFRRGCVNFSGRIHAYTHWTANARILRLEATPEYCIHHFNYLDGAHFVRKLNHYTSVEAALLHEQGVRFSYRALLHSVVKEIYTRFFKFQGYRGGVRGFALSMFMAFYRALTYIKLWERYEFEDRSPAERYHAVRRGILEAWRKVRV